MSTVLNVLLPIFGLILVGYICRRTNRLGPTAASEMNRFVVWLGLPALLFSLTAKADWAQIWQPGFLLAFTGGMLAVFLVTLVYRWKTTGSLVDASIDGLSAGYANTGYIGIPLCVLVLGEDGMAPALIASLLVVCVLFGLAVVCIEVGLQSKKGLGGAIVQVVTALLKNPLVIAPLLGAAWAFGGVQMPAALDEFLRLLGAATVPCALVSLGLFLAQRQSGSERRRLAAGGAEAGAATAGDLVHRFRAARPASLLGACRVAAQRTADRHRAVHARRVLPAPGGAGVAGDPVFHPRLAADPVADPAGDQPLSCSSRPSCRDKQGQRCQADAVSGAARRSR